MCAPFAELSRSNRLSFIDLTDCDLIWCTNRDREGMIQISDQIFNVLDSDREPHQLLGNSHFGPMFGRNHRMRGEHRNGDQRLGSAETRCQSCQRNAP